VGKPFQTRSEGAFRTLGSPGNTSQLTLVTGEKTHDEIRFPVGVSAQDERLAHLRGHNIGAIP
jgi:hypothetical protein